MKIVNGLPVEDNASDKQDSVRLAAICRIFDFRIKVPMLSYFLPAGVGIVLRDQSPPEKPLTDSKGRIIPHIDYTRFDKDLFVRSPHEYKFDLSRDQWVCLTAALGVEGNKHMIDRKYVNGMDLMSPTIDGHERRCKGLRASLWQNLWLWADMIAHAKFTPLEEPNQILIMAKKAKKLKAYCWLNPQWREALRRYWITTRAKPEIELCEHIIKHIEGEIV